MPEQAIKDRTAIAGIGVLMGLVGLSLSGAPWMALLFGIGGTIASLLDRPDDAQARERDLLDRFHHRR